jgi:hypothetical protein
MQETDHNIEKDNFRKIIKEKLEGYSLPVDDDVWNKIEKNLDKKPQKVLWPWISGTAAVVAVALLALLLFPINDKINNNHETTDSLPEHAETINEDVPLETVNQPVSTSSVKPERIFVTEKAEREYTKNGSYSEIDVTKNGIASVEDSGVAHSAAESNVKNERPSHLNQQEKFAFQDIDPFGDDSPSVPKSKKRKSIGLSIGSGGNLLAMNTNSGDQLASDAAVGQLRYDFYDAVSASKTEEHLLTEDFPDITHRIPLSFGLTVKKELNRTFSLETGLVYTFLDSRFENRSMRKKALLQLHYVGIPLNVQARISGGAKNNWEIYLSAGGMVEKGIYSHYKQTNYVSDNNILTTVSNEKINGLQYSLSFAPGIDYKIYRNYSIYLEPKISYYFDNNQPVSVRTEHPVVIGINAGLRFCW